MIRGVGTDICSVKRLERDLARLGDGLARRILHPDEWEDFAAHRFPARFLAKRFAAKEAVAKALGTGFRHGMGPRHIRIDHDAAGKPIVVLEGPAAHLLARIEASVVHATISDEKEYAVAFVVIE
ncbi:MAG: holo-ACP synthase [Pseudomonadota bacterium]|nr:holo-ACP synthase [Pseudomonadota bacterium]